MSLSTPKSWASSTAAVYLVIGAALLVLSGLALWGTYRDLHFLRQAVLRSEMADLRAEAVREAGHIEAGLGEGRGLRDLAMGAWPHVNWDLPKILYVAVVDDSNNLVAYPGMADLAGTVPKKLPSGWYMRRLEEIGSDVVLTNPEVDGLAPAGMQAYDVGVPIRLGGVQYGEYHMGLNAPWFEQWLDDQEEIFLRRRAVPLAIALLVTLLGGWGLVHAAARERRLRATSIRLLAERTTELGKLAGGLAHEIRNPLHAIRLNLHAFRRAQADTGMLSSDEIQSMLDQSSREIERIDHLLQRLLGFATPDDARPEVLDVASELEEVVDFIRQELLRSSIQVEVTPPDGPVLVHMDRGRLRQIMLQLLQNAQEAIRDGGQIRIQLQRCRSQAVITVRDTGSGVSEADRPRIFEPFFSTRAGGTGLGLSLVKRFINEVGGTIDCINEASGGTTFRVTLPLASQARLQGTIA